MMAPGKRSLSLGATLTSANRLRENACAAAGRCAGCEGHPELSKIISCAWRRASWELLLTAPVSTLEVVLGKFAALWGLFMTCLAPWLYFLAVLRCWNGRTTLVWGLVPWFDGPGLAFDPGPFWGGCIGLAVVGATFVAVGLFCSGLCRGPASAALLSLSGMGTILLVGL